MTRCTISLMLSATVTLSGCGNQTPPAAPPTVPPLSTMQVAETRLLDRNAAGGALQFENWGWAVANVGVWNTVLTVTLAIPVAAFGESFNHTPQQRAGDGAWVWAYDAVVNGAAYHAELSALAVGGDVNWSMALSREGMFTDYVWFTGVSNLLATAGTWTLNMNPADSKPLVSIDWQRAADNTTASLLFTNILPDSPDNGGTIDIGVTTRTDYDVTYTIVVPSTNHTTAVEWNRTTKLGRVSDVQHFGDDAWRCWDGEFRDTPCEGVNS